MGQGEVLLYGHARRGALHGVLEHAPDCACPLVLGQEGDVPATQGDVAGIQPEGAADGVEERALAGAVGADDSGELSFVHVQGEAVERRVLDGGAALEYLARVFYIKHPARLPSSALRGRHSI